MPPQGHTEALDRLVRLLAALTSDWQDRDVLIELVGLYPDAPLSANAMLRRDMHSLQALGFLVERAPGHHEPLWRLVGHERFGAEVRVKYCKRCDQWRPLDDFFTDRNRSSGTSIYCRFCNSAVTAAWYKTAEGLAYGRKAGKIYRQKHRERINARWRIRYRQRKAKS